MLMRIVLTYTVVVNLLLVDQAVKAASVSMLKDRTPYEVVPGLFNLAYVENRGCAWGMFQGHVWPLAVFAILALVFLAWKRRSIFPPGRIGLISEVLLYAGIIGNLLDRVVRGFVVDMFDFHWGVHHFPVFNVADSYITVAAGILILVGLLQSDGKKRNPSGVKNVGDGGAS